MTYKEFVQINEKAASKGTEIKLVSHVQGEYYLFEVDGKVYPHSIALSKLVEETKKGETFVVNHSMLRYNEFFDKETKGSNAINYVML